MASLRNFIGRELLWVRPNLFKGFYELRAALSAWLGCGSPAG
jgi:hypothetical protein